MSLYNMLFGRNSQTDLLLAVIGFKPNDVERLRDVFAEDEGATIAVYTRTGGGNREDYPQAALYASPHFRTTFDDDFDTTYATFVFNTPPEFVDDVRNLSDVLEHGLRPEFVRHLAATLRREPTEADREHQAYESERQALSRLAHSMANGHTFVPHSDAAMKGALKLAEANDGSLRSCWGLLPLRLVAIENARHLGSYVRVAIDYKWEVDDAYLARCVEQFSTEFPKAVARMVGEAASVGKRRS